MKKNSLLAALFLLAASGLMLHYRIHNFMVPDRLLPSVLVFDGSKFLASLLPAIDVVVVTSLFMSRRTAAYGYLLNGLIVIYGTLLMGHYSIAEMVTRGVPIEKMVLKSTIPDIGIAWGDFFVGKALYDHYMKPVKLSAPEEESARE
ncbi:MAG: hypothetical protein HZB33_10495 [Nitrospirae bacterium]|nr:hypothetical protein [Nitrospirota bacterium]